MNVSNNFAKSSISGLRGCWEWLKPGGWRGGSQRAHYPKRRGFRPTVRGNAHHPLGVRSSMAQTRRRWLSKQQQRRPKRWRPPAMFPREGCGRGFRPTVPASRRLWVRCDLSREIECASQFEVAVLRRRSDQDGVLPCQRIPLVSRLIKIGKRSLI
jgi:hypothetical protein